MTSTDELRQFVITSIEDLRNWVQDIQEYGQDYGTPAACASEQPAEAAPPAKPAPIQKEQSPEKPATADPQAPPQPATAEITMETVRAKLANLMDSGKQAQVKELLTKYGGGKLSEVAPENYPDLLKEAGEL